MIAGGEMVWVVPREELFPGGAPHGFWTGDESLLAVLRTRGRFAPRAQVEEDPSLKQVIPYAIVAQRDRIFLMRRSREGVERRLYGLRTIGVGGHVNPVDREDVVHHTLRREVEEEIFLPRGWSARIVGFLNDDTTSVGSVHVGVVAVIDAGRGDVGVREEDRMSGSFVGRAELLELHARERSTFESWSALLLDRFDEVLAWETPPASSTTTPRPTPTSTT